VPCWCAECGDVAGAPPIQTFHVEPPERSTWSYLRHVRAKRTYIVKSEFSSGSEGVSEHRLGVWSVHYICEPTSDFDPPLLHWTTSYTTARAK